MSGRLRFGEFSVGLGALIAAVLGVGLIVWVNIDRMVAVDGGDREAREALADAGAVTEALYQGEADLRGYVATSNLEFLRDYQRSSARFAAALPRLAAQVANDPGQRAGTSELGALYDRWTDSVATPEIAMVRTGAAARAQATVRGRSGQQQMRAMMSVIEQLRAAENRTLRLRADAQAQAFVTARWTLVLGALGALAVAGLFGGRSLLLLTRSRDAAQRALKAAEAASEAKTRFLANISHEIRTPLNGVAGVADVLARSRLEPKQLDLVETIRRSAAEVDGILADILTVSRGHSETESATSAPFNLTQLVEGAADEHRPAASAKGVDLVVHLPDAAKVAVEGDATLLRRILDIYLSNAVKFTDRGVIQLVVIPLEDACYRFEVRDTGVGFDAAGERPRFDAFSQFDDSSTRRHGGAGLGLAVARLAAVRIGAVLDCDSVPGAGSTFTVEARLPGAEATAEPAASPDAAPDPSDDAASPSLRVLIVDDHPTNRQVLELILDQFGVEWVSVEDGQQAVEAVAHQTFSAILMDIQMPIMDGFAATREIRRLELQTSRPREPVIIVSANCQPEHVRLGAEAGAQRHLSKPVRAEDLLEALSEVIEEQQLAA